MSDDCFTKNPNLGMNNQALFSSKDKNKKFKMSSAAIFVWHFKGKKVYLV